MASSVTKIVVVDDEKEMAQLLKIELESEGYQVSMAHDGKAGFALIRGMKPNLVILDVMMPKMDGYEVLNAIRGDPTIKDIPVIMLSAKGLENEVKKGLRLGATEYILRPFDPESLIKRIKVILEK